MDRRFNHQEGRLFLQIAADGATVGWLNNRAANQSFRMSGRISAAGAVELACQCPPGQAFSARGTMRAGANDLKGQLSLSSGTGTFGHSQVSLKRRTQGGGAH